MKQFILENGHATFLIDTPGFAYYDPFLECKGPDLFQAFWHLGLPPW